MIKPFLNLRQIKLANLNYRFVVCTAVCSLLFQTRLPAQVHDAKGANREATIIEESITDDDREHWSFTSLIRPRIPNVSNSTWCRNPIDYFILAELENSSVKPAKPCDPQGLLRRLSFDLLGLPPAIQDAQNIRLDGNDQALSEEAYGRLVDRLLADPAFGERWAQHWLDLARYAETDGFEHDKTRQDVWRYRDWVVNALNTNMPYDEFVRLQISGDLVDSGKQAIATAFCTAGPDMPDINEQDLRRFDKLNELTGTVGSALLGLTMQCAQCHDHKYDPISQADFYRLRAIFNSAMPVMVRNKHVISLTQSENTPESRFHYRGEMGKPGPKVPAGFPRILVATNSDSICATDEPRLEFANWLFNVENPITSRVIVNRIWQHHFGRSLTENPSDFGVVAGGPTHPDLLDWLACELIDSDWDLKHIHKLILTSSTYRQSGLTSEEVDSETVADIKDLYGIFPRRRLEGEIVRDAMLHCAGLLTRKVGGNSVMPPLPPEMSSTLLRGQWKTSLIDQDHYRRSIYVFARRNLRYPIFDVFDRPDAGASCARRDKSTTALQSLQMLNSPFTFQCAQQLSSRLLAAKDSDANRDTESIVEQIYLNCYGRRPKAEESNLIVSYLSQSQDLKAAVLECVVAVFNSNEFLYID